MKVEQKSKKNGTEPRLLSAVIHGYKNRLSEELDENRYIHSVNCMVTAASLAEHFGCDIEKAMLAGLLHDCGKNFKGDRAREMARRIGYEPDAIELAEPKLLHGFIGAHLARVEYGIEDEAVLSAIRWHTTGKAGMTLLEKIIYIADYIEPARSFPGVEILRAEAYDDLDRCIVMATDGTIAQIMKKVGLLHPHTVDTRNHSLLCMKSEIKRDL